MLSDQFPHSAQVAEVCCPALARSPKAVDLMLAQLGGALPRELTGRSRYRAWGIV